MQYGFKIHKQAVLLEYSLNAIVQQGKGKEVADITMIYEYPIRVMDVMLQEVKRKNEDLKERIIWIIHMIQERYRPYESCVLIQLEETICKALCEDLVMLHEQMRKRC